MGGSSLLICRLPTGSTKMIDRRSYPSLDTSDIYAKLRGRSHVIMFLASVVQSNEAGMFY